PSCLVESVERPSAPCRAGIGHRVSRGGRWWGWEGGRAFYREGRQPQGEEPGGIEDSVSLLANPVRGGGQHCPSCHEIGPKDGSHGPAPSAPRGDQNPGQGGAVQACHDGWGNQDCATSDSPDPTKGKGSSASLESGIGMGQIG